MNIRLAVPDDARRLSDYYLVNAEHLSPWEPLREPGYHDPENWHARLLARDQEQKDGKSAFFIALLENSDEIIATCSLTNIIYGPFQACNMGYSIARAHEGNGYMQKIVARVLDYAFSELNLHRVMAGYMPANTRSGRLLERMGFVREGFAEKYVCINGRWEDHILTSLLNPAHR